MNCQNCGAELKKHAKFCEICGEAVQEKKEEVQAKPAAMSIQRKPMPKWYVITTMVLSILLAVAIVGAVFNVLPDLYMYALIVYLAGVVPVGLFHVVMIIVFKAKRYERSSFVLPWIYILLYLFTTGIIGMLTFLELFYLDQTAWIMLGNNIFVGFLLLCFGLYYLLRE